MHDGPAMEPCLNLRPKRWLPYLIGSFGLVLNAALLYAKWPVGVVLSLLFVWVVVNSVVSRLVVHDGVLRIQPWLLKDRQMSLARLASVEMSPVPPLGTQLLLKDANGQKIMVPSLTWKGWPDLVALIGNIADDASVALDLGTAVRLRRYTDGVEGQRSDPD